MATMNWGSVDAAIASEVIRNALMVAVEEASIVIVRSSYSIFIQEGADACAALLSPEGELIAQSMATSLMHGASLRTTLPHLLEDHPLESMSPGDIFATNDPYRGGIHANDILIFRPIFDADRVQFFAGTLIHVADLGGVAAGGLASTAGDTFAEGMLLPPVRIYERGNPVESVMRILERNSRIPKALLGDINALVAGANVAASRIEALFDRYSAAQVTEVSAAFVDYVEVRVREELRKLPSGTYHGRFTIESDGVDPGRTFDVDVRATVGDGSIELDFSDSSAQSAGAINSSLSQTLSGVVFGVRCFIDPTIPMNEGCFRPITVKLPKGSIVNPTPPAACGGRIVTVTAAIEAVVGALSQAQPDIAVASSGLVHVITMAGDGWLTMLYEFGGIGARHGDDGPDATGAFFLGGRSTIPQIEPIEAQYPLRVQHTRLRPDSGGPGTWRGGLGVEVAIQVLEDITLSVRGDRIYLPPPGSDGGEPGLPGFFRIDHADGTSEPLPAKQSHVRVKAGEVVVLATSGGGGLGPPSRRAPDLVRGDLHAGRVTQDAATMTYGTQP